MIIDFFLSSYFSNLSSEKSIFLLQTEKKKSKIKTTSHLRVPFIIFSYNRVHFYIFTFLFDNREAGLKILEHTFFQFLILFQNFETTKKSVSVF